MTLSMFATLTLNASPSSPSLKVATPAACVSTDGTSAFPDMGAAKLSPADAGPAKTMRAAPNTSATMSDRRICFSFRTRSNAAAPRPMRDPPPTGDRGDTPPGPAQPMMSILLGQHGREPHQHPGPRASTLAALRDHAGCVWPGPRRDVAGAPFRRSSTFDRPTGSTGAEGSTG